MSLTKTESIEKNRFELQFSVDKATFDAAVTKVYNKKAKNINVPGFRKGKAPRSIVEKMYGQEIFFNDAIDEILPQAYEDAVKEAVHRSKLIGFSNQEIGTLEDINNEINR